jgi:hypothetical protein
LAGPRCQPASRAVKIGANGQIAAGEMPTIRLRSSHRRAAGSEIAKHVSRSCRLGVKKMMTQPRSAKIALAVLVIGAGVGLALTTLAGPALAQSIPPGATPPVAASGATVEGLEADGRITAVDAAARTIRLENGVEYLMPGNLAFDWSAIREGSVVKLRYSIDEGRNLIRAVQVLFR